MEKNKYAAISDIRQLRDSRRRITDRISHIEKSAHKIFLLYLIRYLRGK